MFPLQTDESVAPVGGVEPRQTIIDSEPLVPKARGDGDELLPIQYDDNYVTAFPGETVEIHGVVQRSAGLASWIKLEGYNTQKNGANTAACDPPF